MIYDLVIVGAGPAGCACAMSAPAGKTLLLNGQPRERPKTCGGLLSPAAQKLIARLGLTLPKDVLVDPQIFSVKTVDVVSGIAREYPRHYLNMDRAAFDRWLLSLVPDSVEVENGRCVAVDKRDGLFELTVRVDSNTRVVRARRVVGADGAGSVVRRAFFPAMDRCMAIQQRFPAVRTPFYSCLFDDKTSPHCSWTICKDGELIFGGCFEPRGCRAAFEEQKARVGEALGLSLNSPLYTEACLVALPRRMSDFQTGRDGAFLAGEAAGFISPSSYEGISWALLSGTLLGQALRHPADDAARAYHRLTRPLRQKLGVKLVKRGLLYTPVTRRVIMASGVASLSSPLPEKHGRERFVSHRPLEDV